MMITCNVQVVKAPPLNFCYETDFWYFKHNSAFLASDVYSIVAEQNFASQMVYARAPPLLCYTTASPQQTFCTSNF